MTSAAVCQSGGCHRNVLGPARVAGRTPQPPARTALRRGRPGPVQNIPGHRASGGQFRADAYNVFTHANFGLPGTDATADIDSPGTFAVINNLVSQPREFYNSACGSISKIAFRVLKGKRADSLGSALSLLARFKPQRSKVSPVNRRCQNPRAPAGRSGHSLFVMKGAGKSLDWTLAR